MLCPFSGATTIFHSSPVKSVRLARPTIHPASMERRCWSWTGTTSSRTPCSLLPVWPLPRTSDGLIHQAGTAEISLPLDCARARGLKDKRFRRIFGKQLQGQRSANLTGHFGLHVENIAQVAVVAAGPQVSLSPRFDQLGGDADTFAIAADAAFQYVVHVQFPRNLSNGFLCGHVLNGRRPRDDSQPLRIELGELRDHLFGEAIGEVVPFTAAAQICEWQRHQHLLFGGRTRALQFCDGGDKAVTNARHGFDEPWAPRPVSEQLAHFADGGVQTMFVTNDRIRP